jgi:DNA-directed RNA polymerase specialized sigma24 family protein
VRRYRAERLLRDEFERLRDSVVGSVRGRLRAAGVPLDASDVDAAYAQAWQGLYAATLEGQRIVDPSGWLALVTYRRAIDEHRARQRVQWAAMPTGLDGNGWRERCVASEPDLAAELDDRARLRQLFEALRGRLTVRERQAAALCYLQGLSRSEAAARMGVSEARMRKLMEGRNAGAPGVAGKVGALVETIRAGAWCEEQGSLMRGFAYGILDPGGERYRLALIHRDECPACRAYVLSLRGLAAVLPPVPLLLQLTLGASAATGVAGSGAVAASGAGTATGTVAGTGVGAGAGAGAGVGAGAGAGAGAGIAGQSAAGVGGGALGASGAAGAGVAGIAGGGWWLAGGPLGAKLAVGCLLALGVGAGCVALDGGTGHPSSHTHRQFARDAHAIRSESGYEAIRATPARGRLSRAELSAAGAAPVGGVAPPTGSASQANREFGPERTAASGDPTGASTRSSAATVTATSAQRAASAPAQPATGEPVAGAGGAGSASSAGVSAAQREFAPG